jgi:hypothetical protein
LRDMSKNIIVDLIDGEGTQVSSTMKPRLQIPAEFRPEFSNSVPIR